MGEKNSLSALEGLRSLSVAPGAVYIGPWADIDHEKYLVVAGVSDDRFLVCSVLINSKINLYIQRRPRMLSCQVLLKSADYDFLSHDSYANCAQPIRAKFDVFVEDNRKYCGILKEADICLIQQRIIASGQLTADEIKKFFRK